MPTVEVCLRTVQDGVQVVEIREDGELQLTALLMTRSLVFSEVMLAKESLSSEVLQALGQLMIQAGGTM